MTPELFGMMAGAVAMGVAGARLIDHIMPAKTNGHQEAVNGWRSKMETLVSQQIKCADKMDAQIAEQNKALLCLSSEMAQHHKDVAQAWRDNFEIIRTIKDNTTPKGPVQ